MPEERLNPPMVERLDIPWTANVIDRAHLRSTPERLGAARVAQRLARSVRSGWFYGGPPWETHEGGLWLEDRQGWFCVRNLVGIDPAGMLGLDPALVDQLRVNARRVYARFPEAVHSLLLRELLDRPITTRRDVRRWVDSICNVSLPMPHRVHSAQLPEGPGIDHYPTPVVDIEFFKRDDFVLWATDAEGTAVALAPGEADGGAEGSMLVLWAAPGSRLGDLRNAAQARGLMLMLDRITSVGTPLADSFELTLPGEHHPVTHARAPFAVDAGAASKVVPGGPVTGRFAWSRHIPARPPRTMSPEYRHTRAVLAPIVGSLMRLAHDRVGSGWRQIHHGGGLWLKDERGWFMVRNLAGIEWSAQFCADPAKVDRLRVNAQRLYGRFPEAVRELGIGALLNAPIRTDRDVARFCDSVLNASMPLYPAAHNGILPHGAGYHMYPGWLCDLQYVTRRDFPLFLPNGSTRPSRNPAVYDGHPGREGLA